MTVVVERNLKPAAYEQITGLSAAKGFTAGLLTRVDAAFVQTEAQDVRWRDDGTNPTASVGMRLTTLGAGLWYTGNLAAIRFIEEAVGAKLNVTYYRY